MRLISGTIYEGPKRVDTNNLDLVAVKVKIGGTSVVEGMPNLYGGVHDEEEDGETVTRYGKWVILRFRISGAGVRLAGWPTIGQKVLIHEESPTNYWAEPLYESFPDENMESLDKVSTIAFLMGT